MNRNHLSLLVATIAILTASLPASAQQSPGEVNLVGVGVSILSNIFNPPSRSAEIAADTEVKKAKIKAEMEIEKEKLRIAASANTDSVTPILKGWGVDRVNCAPGLVFINGVGANTICVQPSTALAAGYYSYDKEKGRLLRTSSTASQTSQTTQTTQVSGQTGEQIGQISQNNQIRQAIGRTSQTSQSSQTSQVSQSSETSQVSQSSETSTNKTRLTSKTTVKTSGF
jgi:uncharacterized membrane protein YgaE (UPF0421/DUF939 family)